MIGHSPRAGDDTILLNAQDIGFLGEKPDGDRTDDRVKSSGEAADRSILFCWRM